jgi:hypothetical protein
MKHSNLLVALIAMCGLFVAVNPAAAQSFWDPAHLHASPGSGGSGVWNNIAWQLSILRPECDQLVAVLYLANSIVYSLDNPQRQDGESRPAFFIHSFGMPGFVCSELFDNGN